MAKRSRHPLIREITLALIFKLAALTLLYLAFFGPGHRIETTPRHMAAAILGPSPSGDPAR
jgi:hypothetical protein